MGFECGAGWGGDRGGGKCRGGGLAQGRFEVTIGVEGRRARKKIEESGWGIFVHSASFGGADSNERCRIQMGDVTVGMGPMIA